MAGKEVGFPKKNTGGWYPELVFPKSSVFLLKVFQE